MTTREILAYYFDLDAGELWPVTIKKNENEYSAIASLLGGSVEDLRVVIIDARHTAFVIERNNRQPLSFKCGWSVKGCDLMYSSNAVIVGESQKRQSESPSLSLQQISEKLEIYRVKPIKNDRLDGEDIKLANGFLHKETVRLRMN